MCVCTCVCDLPFKPFLSTFSSIKYNRDIVRPSPPSLSGTSLCVYWSVIDEWNCSVCLKWWFDLHLLCGITAIRVVNAPTNSHIVCVCARVCGEMLLFYFLSRFPEFFFILNRNPLQLNSFPLPPLQPLVTLYLLICTLPMNLTIADTWKKWDNTILALLCLAYFTKHSIFRVHLYHSRCQNFLSFRSWMIFQGVDGPHRVCASPARGHASCFYCSAAVSRGIKTPAFSFGGESIYLTVEWLDHMVISLCFCFLFKKTDKHIR